MRIIYAVAHNILFQHSARDMQDLAAALLRELREPAHTVLGSSSPSTSALVKSVTSKATSKPEAAKERSPSTSSSDAGSDKSEVEAEMEPVMPRRGGRARKSMAPSKN